MKKKEEQLVRKVTDMIQKTREGKLHWDIQCQTTEYNDPAKKPVETEEGNYDYHSLNEPTITGVPETISVLDESFVSYHCMDQEKEFLLVSYEQIYTCGEKKKSCNLIFLPPLGIRFFDVDVLAPYAVEADQMLVYEVHMLKNLAGTRFPVREIVRFTCAALVTGMIPAVTGTSIPLASALYKKR